MYTLIEGIINLIPHIMNIINKLLKDFIPKKTLSSLDDIPIKKSVEEKK